MSRVTVYLVMMCATINILVAGNWHFEALHRLHTAKEDPCTALHRTNDTIPVRQAKMQCYSYFMHFDGIPSSMKQRCPLAQDARCRLIKKKVKANFIPDGMLMTGRVFHSSMYKEEFKCTVLIQPPNKPNETDPDYFDTVELAYCIKHFEDWDKLLASP